MCYQDAGWKNGPWIGYGENVKNHSTYVTWREYFSAHASEKISDVWRLSQEDIRVSLMWGSQVLQRIAQQVRHSENAIIKAEKLLSMASLETGRTLPDTIFDEAWRTLLLAQHHDSWIVPYNHLNKQRTWADEIALWTANTDKISDEIIRKAQSFFVHDTVTAGSGIHTLHIQPDSYLRIYNTLPKDRTEVITVKLPQKWNDKKITVLDKDGKCLPSVQQINGNEARLSCKVSVPSFGYTTLQVKETEAGQNPPVAGITLPVPTECVMENDLYKITFDLAFGGKIKSLIAKNLGNKEFIDPNDAFGFNELRGYFYEKGQFLSNTERPAQVAILEDNALKKQIKIESKIGEHTCYQIITFNQSQERIDCSLQINWQGNVGIGEYKQPNNWEESRRAFYDDRFKLNVLFPVTLSARKIYKDAPFDVCESRLENTFYNTWDSIKNTILLHWVDVMQGDGTYGFALLSDHTTTYSHGNDFPLGLTAQYSGQGLWGRDYLITQPLHIEYALIPHKGKWDDAQIATQSNGWNEPMIVSFDPVELSERSFIRFDKPGYELTSLKTDGEKQLILRIFNQESDEKPLKIKLDFPVEKGEEIALNGELITTCLLEDDRNIRIAIPRFGIKTIRIHKKQ
jgi:alpha-mannosidase